MASGLIVPVSSNALGFALVGAVVITVIWMIFGAIRHSANKSREESFSAQPRSVRALKPEQISNVEELLTYFPLKKINIHDSKVMYWSSENFMSIAVAASGPQSLYKVFVRLKGGASVLGHKILIDRDERFSEIQLKLTSESLIYSTKEFSFYDANLESLKSLKARIEGGTRTLGEKINISENEAIDFVKWVDDILIVYQKDQSKLLI